MKSCLLTFSGIQSLYPYNNILKLVLSRPNIFILPREITCLHFISEGPFYFRKRIAWKNSQYLEMPPLVPQEMTSEEWAQKFHTDDMSLPRSVSYFWLVEANFPHGTTNQKHCPNLCSASDWLKQISLMAQPIRSTAQICVVTHHQYQTAAFLPQTLFQGNTSYGVVWLFSWARKSRVSLTGQVTFLPHLQGPKQMPF